MYLLYMTFFQFRYKLYAIHYTFVLYFPHAFSLH